MLWKSFKKNAGAITLLGSFLLLFSFVPIQIPQARSATVDELKGKIQERTDLIKKLEEEIKTYKAAADKANGEATTLSSTIKSLDASRKKLEKEIDLTKQRITVINLEILDLSKQIKSNQESIDSDMLIVENALARLNQNQDQTELEILLSGNSFSKTWDEIEKLNTFQSNLRDEIKTIQMKKQTLEQIKVENEKNMKKLDSFKKDLTSQSTSLKQTAKEKQDLLTATKSKESAYKKLMEDRAAQITAFEAEVAAYAESLKIAIDPSKIPTAKKGILSWPLDKVTITQSFGFTDFANQNNQLYKGSGHDGIDLRASIGTPVKAALSGTVMGTGNTDAVKNCYSYGKWVVVDHGNGFSTIYGHLSAVQVSPGEAVTTGEVIGLSGNTGASTGPHLHFSLYATEGVRIQKYNSLTPCNGAVFPITVLKARLNPLSYL